LQPRKTALGETALSRHLFPLFFKIDHPNNCRCFS
jgi:hypothetical protein